ncbi:MAG TPA: hypothetical protein VFR30_07855 [Lysobacter sp.]|nr:hypothetical protein [Lysobacter sp.]
MNTETSFEIIPVWKNVTAEISSELIDLWSRNRAIDDPDRAKARASQAVCIARDSSGAICGVGTAIVRVLPRLRQPMYFYRQFFAPEFRGQKQSVAFLNRARQLLQGYNASLETPESLGVLLELENPMLAKHYTRAYEPVADSTFIGYSPKGLQLRVSYFDEARLLPPVQLRRRTAAMAGRPGHA